MPDQSHQRAAEFHEQAAHAHRAAAVRHGKRGHLTGHERSKETMGHANKAFGWLTDAHQKSENSVKESS